MDRVGDTEGPEGWTHPVQGLMVKIWLVAMWLWFVAIVFAFGYLAGSAASYRQMTEAMRARRI